MRLYPLLVIIQCLDYIGRALGSNPRPQVLVDFIDHLAADEPGSADFFRCIFVPAAMPDFWTNF